MVERIVLTVEREEGAASQRDRLASKRRVEQAPDAKVPRARRRPEAREPRYGIV